VTPRQKALVRRSWVRLGEQSETLSALFYERLLTINPNARRLFSRKDMHRQGTLFTQMLAAFLRSLDDDEAAVRQAIEASGRRHVGYGVMYSDYDAVGEALLWAVEQVLGPRFSADTREAWAAAYRALAGTMRGISSSVL
jgi:hemoglobin-like flavoprotein